MNSLFKRTVGHRRRRPRIADIPDRLGRSPTNLENRARLHFPDASQISAMAGDNSRQMKAQICTVGDVGDDFAHYQPSKLLASSLPIIHLCTNFNFWFIFHFPPNSKSGESGPDFR